jgi:hypothetical protein
VVQSARVHEEIWIPDPVLPLHSMESDLRQLPSCLRPLLTHQEDGAESGSKVPGQTWPLGIPTAPRPHLFPLELPEEGVTSPRSPQWVRNESHRQRPKEGASTAVLCTSPSPGPKICPFCSHSAISF